MSEQTPVPPYDLSHFFVRVSGHAFPTLHRAGDLIVSLNGEALPPGTTKDAFLDRLVAIPRPVCIGFRLQK